MAEAATDMMRVLLVEDDPDQVDVFCDAVRRRDSSIEIDVAASRSSAMGALENEFFDIIVCDLRIPTVDGGLDTALEHGIDVQRYIATAPIGTPSIFFSAYGAELLLDQHVTPFADQADPFGVGSNRPMLEVRDKRRMDQCIDDIVVVAQEVVTLEGIPLALSAGVSLSPAEERLVRLVARHYDARECDVELLSGGLSSARSFKLAATDDGILRLRAALKVDILTNIEREEHGYRNLAGILESDVVATQARIQFVGAGHLGGIVYSLATDHSSLFRVAHDDPARALEALATLRSRLEGRSVGAPLVGKTVRSVRQLFMDDEELSARLPEDLVEQASEVEDHVVAVREALAHGDLHGGNVLVNASGHPLLIDFASVMQGPAALDAVLLELSFVLHPYGRELMEVEPDLADLDWADIDEYCGRAPVPDVVRACREWSFAVAGSSEEVWSVAYAWAARQFRYEGADHRFAHSLVERTLTLLRESITRS